MHRLVFAASLAACSASPTAIPVEREMPAPPHATTVAEIDPAASLPEGIRVVPVQGPMATDAALEPLRAIVGPATVVGLGDSAPASDGFADAKARLAEFLVGPLGFRVVAFEANRAEMASAARYVASCGMAATVPSLDSGGMRDLLAWMCDFNRSHVSDPVSIIGFDVTEPEADVQTIRVGVTRAAESDAPALLSAMEACANPENPFDPCRASLSAIDMYLSRNAVDVSQRIGKATLADLRLALTSYRGGRTAAFFAVDDPDRSTDAREDAMAAVLETELAGIGNPKAVLWANGSHLTARADRITDSSLPGTRSMGTSLRGDFGTHYQAIDLIGWDVEVDAPGVGYVRAPGPSAASVESCLHSLGQSSLLVDLESSGVTTFFGPKKYELGAPTPQSLVPNEQFRALVYLDRSL